MGMEGERERDMKEDPKRQEKREERKGGKDTNKDQNKKDKLLRMVCRVPEGSISDKSQTKRTIR
jgi:hypothetical protein